MSTSKAARAQKIDELHDTLAEGVAALVDSGQWKEWLDFLASFHRYSFNNSVLILRQRPEATAVAGFKAWQTKGRQVRKGEKGIKIFGKPFRAVTDTDEHTGEKTRRTVPTPPPVVTVFDIDQTDPIDGADVPAEPARPLTGDDPHGILAALTEKMSAHGWTIVRAPIDGPAHGFCTVDGSKEIHIDTDLSDAHAAKTMIHEAAHALLHTDDAGKLRDDVDNATREVEAESTAYAVAGLAELDTSDYSIGYVAGWADGDADKVRAAAARIRATVHELADALTPEAEEVAA